MAYFRTDNTEGYSQAELDALNAELEERLAALGLEPGSDAYNDAVKAFAGEVSRRPVPRYRIHPIADENCSSLDTDNLLAATDDLAEAERLADGHSNWPFGTGILDTHTGKIDLGFGFGVPA